MMSAAIVHIVFDRNTPDYYNHRYNGGGVVFYSCGLDDWEPGGTDAKGPGRGTVRRESRLDAAFPVSGRFQPSLCDFFLIGCLMTVFHFSGATFLASDM